jgi:hypothetical protein
MPVNAGRSIVPSSGHQIQRIIAIISINETDAGPAVRRPIMCKIRTKH